MYISIYLRAVDLSDVKQERIRTNEISFGSDIHGVPVEGDVGRPVGESFMMFTRQNYVSENKTKVQRYLVDGHYFIVNKTKNKSRLSSWELFVNIQ